MIEKIRFKHLEGLTSGKPDYVGIMVDVLGFNNRRLGRRRVFNWKFKQAFNLVEQMKTIDIKKVEENPDCKIKRPSNVDNISYMAMMEIQTLSLSEGTLIDSMAELITKVCYCEYTDKDYSSESKEYADLKTRVLNSPMLDAIGLYNWITKALEDSNKLWSTRFFEVEVSDPDYDNAGGQIMAQFNVINTIKAICNDFNVDFDKAWQMSYGIVQSNSLAKATANYVQEQMRKIKEAKMRSERGQK